MKEALGDPKKYKSACNLFYISKYIVKQIDDRKLPLHYKENQNQLSISKDLLDKINLKNSEFEIET